MRLHALALTVVLCGLPHVGRAQARYGGCAAGTEKGFVTMTRASPLAEWATHDTFMGAVPGDQFALCRYEGPNAIVTLWSHGYGYLVARSATKPIPRPTMRRIATNEKRCVAFEIDSIQLQFGSVEQGRHLLELARRRKVSLGQLAEIRRSERHGPSGACHPG